MTTTEPEPEEGRRAGDGIVVCDACPVLCRIRPGKTGACGRYGNVESALVRMDPFLLARQAAAQSQDLVPFLAPAGGGAEGAGGLRSEGRREGRECGSAGGPG